MLTVEERKRRLPRGAIMRGAERFRVDHALVSRVNSGAERNEKIERWLAGLMDPPTTAEEAYGPPRRILRKPKARAKAGAS